MNRIDALVELRRAHDQVQPKPITQGEVVRDKTACYCVLSPRVVAWLIEELEKDSTP